MSDENAVVRPPMPSLEFLLTCSEGSLRNLELAALNRSANCLKVARLEWQEAAAQREVAGVARWLIQHRQELLEQTAGILEISPDPQFPGEVTVTGPKKGLDMLLGDEERKKK